jgi:hypothetical protein
VNLEKTYDILFGIEEIKQIKREQSETIGNEKIHPVLIIPIV